MNERRARVYEIGFELGREWAEHEATKGDCDEWFDDDSPDFDSLPLASEFMECFAEGALECEGVIA